MGKGSICSDYNSYPLWYEGTALTYDRNFKDFESSPFGGWTQPSMKQYSANKAICSTNANYNWMDDSFLLTYGENANAACTNPQTKGDVDVKFPLTSLTSITSCKSKYHDVNDMGTHLFSVSESGSNTKLSKNFKLREFQSADKDDYLRLSPYIVMYIYLLKLFFFLFSCFFLFIYYLLYLFFIIYAIVDYYACLASQLQTFYNP